jgi:hypothetical protein
MSYSPPTPNEQVQFLRNIQRIFAEGNFVASYKFALLHALCGPFLCSQHLSSLQQRELLGTDPREPGIDCQEHGVADYESVWPL